MRTDSSLYLPIASLHISLFRFDNLLVAKAYDIITAIAINVKILPK